MTILPQWKKCKKCGRTYDWNPDVGITGCPYCMKKKLERYAKFEEKRSITNNKMKENDEIKE